MSTAAAVPPVQRKRTDRQLESAIWLRPRDIRVLYGISPSTLCRLCTTDDAARRLPSVKIVGRGGKKGLRLVKRTDLDAYLQTSMEAQSISAADASASRAR